MSERKIILDSSQRPHAFYKTKDRCAGQFFSEVNRVIRSVLYIIPVWREIRLEIQFHQANEIGNGLIQSDIHLRMTANEGIRKTYDPQSQDVTEKKRSSL